VKLHYYPETDSLYIELNPNPGADSREITNGLVVDAWQSRGVRHRPPLGETGSGNPRDRCPPHGPHEDAMRLC
jgi:hypothetical protein